MRGGFLIIPTQIDFSSYHYVFESVGIDKAYVYRGGVAQPVTIEPGQRTESRVEVITGLMPGDTLITTGTLQLRQGLPVRLENL